MHRAPSNTGYRWTLAALIVAIFFAGAVTAYLFYAIAERM